MRAGENEAGETERDRKGRLKRRTSAVELSAEEENGK